MNDTILFVFEGEIIEGQIFGSIEKNFFAPSDSKATVVRASFCGELFQLWNVVKDDADLDIVEILKERPNADINDLDRNEVSEVHLFMDHDAHSHSELSQQEYHKIICDLLATFNNEFERGKLWINYPMAEAIRHCKKNPDDCFFDTKIGISHNTNYKRLVGKESDFIDIKKFDESIWHYLTAVNIQRIFCLVNDAYRAVSDYSEIKKWFDENAIIVKMIQEKQYEKFINPQNEVVVLSPFPLFLLYYFGKSFFDSGKCGEFTKNCSFCCYCSG